mmetsp:Transcript_5784/g.22831  ORF Transcript_5784/g.22831 Transcript_5784/m.22831 type:complete len:234 (+) Transcript_5784:4932-5633(+)
MRGRRKGGTIELDINLDHIGCPGRTRVGLGDFSGVTKVGSKLCTEVRGSRHLCRQRGCRAHRPRVRERPFHAHSGPRRQFRVRVPAGRIVNDGVHQSVQRNRGPKRVVAPAHAAARFRTKWNERALRADASFEPVQICARDVDAHGSTMYAREVGNARLDHHRRLRKSGFVRGGEKNQMRIALIDVHLEIARFATAAIRVTFVVCFVGDVLSYTNQSLSRVIFVLVGQTGLTG